MSMVLGYWLGYNSEKACGCWELLMLHSSAKIRIPTRRILIFMPLLLVACSADCPRRITFSSPRLRGGQPVAVSENSQEVNLESEASWTMARKRSYLAQVRVLEPSRPGSDTESDSDQETAKRKRMCIGMNKVLEDHMDEERGGGEAASFSSGAGHEHADDNAACPSHVVDHAASVESTIRKKKRCLKVGREAMRREEGKGSVRRAESVSSSVRDESPGRSSMDSQGNLEDRESKGNESARRKRRQLAGIQEALLEEEREARQEEGAGGPECNTVRKKRMQTRRVREAMDQEGEQDRNDLQMLLDSSLSTPQKPERLPPPGAPILSCHALTFRRWQDHDESVCVLALPVLPSL